MSLPTDPTWQTASWTTVQFSELGEEFGWKRGQNDRGPFAEKPYLVAWADVNTFCRNLRGISNQSGGVNGNWIFNGPLLYPDSPSDNIYCTEIAIKATGNIAGAGPIAYTYAIVVVTFTPLTWDGSETSDPFGLNSFGETGPEIAALQTASQELDCGYLEIPRPRSSLKFADGTKIDTPSVLRLPIITMTITWERLPYLPMSAVRTMAGKVNSTVFLGCAVETVLFEPVRTSRIVMSDGTVVQRVQMGFKWRPYSWNWAIRPDTGVWAAITDLGGNKQYQPVDFSALLFR
ncbi:MAG: hypothetical protein P4L84_11165 [Isosphaeraceae bacterium]|nr:hypothetical protein [Isosphaeraceae bacterium]